MRNAFAKEIQSLAGGDSRIVLLSGDIGNRLFDNYKWDFPNRFYNCGVAEANMMSMAAGLAMSGMRPLTYTITPFITTRCYEQIKIDLCYHNLPVIVVGVGSGLSYAALGTTHHSLEDICIMKALPNMTVICPGDAVEVRLAVRESLKHEGPVFIRLGKKNEPVIHDGEPIFVIGKAFQVREGSDICLLSTGNMLPAAVIAAKILRKKGVSVGVVSFHTVKPLDEACLEDAFARYGVVATIEEHGIVGGFGGSVAEWLVDRHAGGGRLLRFGVPDRFVRETGSREHIRNFLGLTPEAIAEKCFKALRGSGGL